MQRITSLIDTFLRSKILFLLLPYDIIKWHKCIGLLLKSIHCIPHLLFVDQAQMDLPYSIKHIINYLYLVLGLNDLIKGIFVGEFEEH